MDKESIRTIVKKVVEDTWYNMRHVNPVDEQIERLTNEIWDEFNDSFPTQDEIDEERDSILPPDIRVGFKYGVSWVFKKMYEQIESFPVYIICWDGIEYTRETNNEELEDCKNEGLLKTIHDITPNNITDAYWVFDFRGNK